MIDLIRGTRNLAGATLLALAVATPAAAAPVLWTLSDVVFHDGGTASGSFVYDADLNAYSSIDITTTAGTEQSGAHYTQWTSLYPHTAEEVVFVEDGAGIDLTGAAVFQILYAPLTNAGGIGDLSAGFEAICADAGCTTIVGSQRLFGANNGILAAANAVPEPGSIAILGTALLGIGIHLRRRHL